MSEAVAGACVLGVGTGTGSMVAEVAAGRVHIPGTRNTGCKDHSTDHCIPAAGMPSVAVPVDPGRRRGCWGCKGCWQGSCSACRCRTLGHVEVAAL